jgi:hypothetical protein
MCRLSLLSLALMTLAGGAVFGADSGFESAVTVADLDFANCSELPVNPRTEPFSVTDQSLASFLRIAGALPPHTAWRTGAGDGSDQYIRLAFTRPLALGTILAVTTGSFSVLRPEAQYPGDVTRDADWLPLEDPHPSGLVRVVPLPPGLQTRAVRVSFHSDKPELGRRSQVDGLRLLKGRYVNLAWDAVPLASSEFGQSEAEREEFSRKGLNDGRPGDLQGGQWRNVPGKPLSEAEPAWAALLWERPQKIAAAGFIAESHQRGEATGGRSGGDVGRPG